MVVAKSISSSSTGLSEPTDQGGGLSSPPDFGRSVTPVLIRSSRLCPNHYYYPWPPLDFQTFLRPCSMQGARDKRSRQMFNNGIVTPATLTPLAREKNWWCAQGEIDNLNYSHSNRSASVQGQQNRAVGMGGHSSVFSRIKSKICTIKVHSSIIATPPPPPEFQSFRRHCSTNVSFWHPCPASVNKYHQMLRHCCTKIGSFFRLRHTKQTIMYVHILYKEQLSDKSPDPFISEKFRIAVMSKTEFVALIRSE